MRSTNASDSASIAGIASPSIASMSESPEPAASLVYRFSLASSQVPTFFWVTWMSGLAAFHSSIRSS